MYPVVNIDRMHGTDNHADLRSVKFGSFSGDDFTAAAINNGSIVVLNKALDHECYFDGDCFSITVDGVDGGAAAAVGSAVYAQNGNVQLKAGSGAIQIGTISRKETKGGKTWLVIDVKEVPAA